MKTDIYVRITADTNDADYIETFQIVDESQIEAIKKMATAIKNFKPYKTQYLSTCETPEKLREWTHHHNYSNGEIRRDDLGEKGPKELYVDSGLVDEVTFEIFEELVPFGECGIHTINDIELIEVKSSISLLKNQDPHKLLEKELSHPWG